MNNYTIEFKWNNLKKITLAVVTGISTAADLIILNDELLESYGKNYQDINIYFFRTRDSAIHYVYRKFVEGSTGINIKETDCVGYFSDSILTECFTSPRPLKRYDLSRHILQDTR